jgi:hypothetical protein
MTGPGYCWTEASAYSLQYRDSMDTPIYKTFAELYAANYKNDAMFDDNGRQVFHPLGLKYLDQPCGSQAQADWRVAAHGTRWPKGRMIGYADSTEGYPANMQPALALAASSGIANGALAWSIFASRAKAVRDTVRITAGFLDFPGSRPFFMRKKDAPAIAAQSCTQGKRTLDYCSI